MMYQFTTNDRDAVMQFEDDGKCYVSFLLILECSYYNDFKSDVLAGTVLQNADGSALTQEEADAFIATLP